ncbi:hypothetical protein [Exiguobacterium sp. SL-9]|uniref:hypothetical protein n=1 Tax=Exiguobacterium sp. SL-9 TaxID=2510963 RepID=UPI0010408358|nr:hypothetical protein [Exiguobacterium sp. SL-9]TCI22588.1 hypothetical protein EVJ34_08225 [Exiguobacterium sp. SL-9]
MVLQHIIRTSILVLLCLAITSFLKIGDLSFTHANSDENVEETIDDVPTTQGTEESPLSESEPISDDDGTEKSSGDELEQKSEDASSDQTPNQEPSKETESGNGGDYPNINTDTPSSESIPSLDYTEETHESQKHSVVPPESTDEPKAKVETNGVVGLSLLSDIQLEGEFDGDNQIKLRVIGDGVLNLNLLKERYVLFKLPDSLFPYIEEASFNGTYDVPNISLTGLEIGRNRGAIATEQWIIDRERKQLVFQANQLLSLSLLSDSTYTFELNFRVDGFPLITPQRYNFYGHLTNDLVDIRALSDGKDQWQLVLDGNEVPFMSLVVPEQIDFGNVDIQSNMGRINRQENMVVTVFHSRTKGTAWQLTAQASALQSASHTLHNTIFFKRKDGTTVSLEQGSQLIETGVMADAPTIIDYERDEGIFLDVQQQMPQSGTYNTIIEWTLIDSI